MISDERVQVPRAVHTIPIWAVDEHCRCGEPASHKVEEVSGPARFHPYTAYLCCRCFRQMVGDCGNYPYDFDTQLLGYSEDLQAWGYDGDG